MEVTELTEVRPATGKEKHKAWDDDGGRSGGGDAQVVLAKVEPIKIIDEEEGEDETAFQIPMAAMTSVSPSHSLSSFRRTKKKRQKEIVLSPRHLESPVAKSTVSAPAFLSSPGRSSVGSSRGREEGKQGSEVVRADTPGSLSSHHQSVGELSLEPGSRSYTPQSDTRSYRERIRDRIQSVREQTTSALVEAHHRSRLKQKRRALPSVSRFDVLLQKEEERVGEALEKHENVRTKWRGERVEETEEMPGEVECYDFFTRVWESEKEEPEQITPSSPQEPGEEEEGAEDRTKLLTAEYLGLKDEWEVVEQVPAVLGDEEEIRSRLRDLIFLPDSTPVLLEDKLPADEEPRYPEEEGLHIGSPLPVTCRRRNRLEQRLLAAGDTKWFGDDGEVTTIPDPQWTAPCRPPLFEDVNPLLESVYRPLCTLCLHSSAQITS